MSRRPDIVAKLQAELDVAMPDPLAIPDITVLQKLPYLNAFVKEGTLSFPLIALMLRLMVHPTFRTPSSWRCSEPPRTRRSIVYFQKWSLQRILRPHGLRPPTWYRRRSSSLVYAP